MKWLFYAKSNVTDTLIKLCGLDSLLRKSCHSLIVSVADCRLHGQLFRIRQVCRLWFLVEFRGKVPTASSLSEAYLCRVLMAFMLRKWPVMIVLNTITRARAFPPSLLALRKVKWVGQSDLSALWRNMVLLSSFFIPAFPCLRLA